MIINDLLVVVYLWCVIMCVCDIYFDMWIYFLCAETTKKASTDLDRAGIAKSLAADRTEAIGKWCSFMYLCLLPKF